MSFADGPASARRKPTPRPKPAGCYSARSARKPSSSARMASSGCAHCPPCRRPKQSPQFIARGGYLERDGPRRLQSDTGHRKCKQMKTIKTNHTRKSVRLPTPDLFDWRSELDRYAADPYAVRSIAKRFRLSRMAARIIAEVAG